MSAFLGSVSDLLGLRLPLPLQSRPAQVSDGTQESTRETQALSLKRGAPCLSTHWTTQERPPPHTPLRPPCCQSLGTATCHRPGYRGKTKPKEIKTRQSVSAGWEGPLGLSPVTRRFVQGDWWRLPKSPLTSPSTRLRRQRFSAGDEGLRCRNTEPNQIES